MKFSTVLPALGVLFLFTLATFFLIGRSVESEGDRLQQVLTHEPENVNAALNLARWHQGEGNFTKAEVLYKRVVAQKPDILLSYYKLSQIREKQGRHKEACDYWGEIADRTKGHDTKYAVSWRESAQDALKECG